jgi:transposase
LTCPKLPHLLFSGIFHKTFIISDLNQKCKIMPRVYVKKKAQGYSQSDIRDAIATMTRDNIPLSIRAASEASGVPRSTISDYLKAKKTGTKRTNSKNKLFDSEQEAALAKRIIDLSARGFPLTILQLRKYACNLAKEFHVALPPSWLKKGLASLDWWYGFRRRHPHLSMRKPEILSKGRAEAFNQDRVESYFRDVMAVIPPDVDPRCIYNLDETGVTNVEAPKKVIASKRARQVASIQIGERGTLTTVVPVINAIGEVFKPFVIIKRVRLTDELRQRAIDLNIELACTKSAYMDGVTFQKLLQHVHNVRPDKEKTAYVFLDGHRSRLSELEGLPFCKDHKIELLCLPPHVTHRLQPLDTHINKIFKTFYRAQLQDHLTGADIMAVTQLQTLTLIAKSYEQLRESHNVIVRSFDHCGIYPLRNTVCKSEFAPTINFRADKSAASEVNEPIPPSAICRPPINEGASTSALPSGINNWKVRLALKSPSKASNPAHKRGHVVHLTSPEAVEHCRRRIADEQATVTVPPAQPAKK